MHSRTVLYDYAMKLVGLPYRWGGDDTIEGFDCSGLVIELLKTTGVLPGGFDDTAEGLRSHPKIKKIATPIFGALVFFGNKKATHVGFCLNNHLMIEAGGGGSKTNNIDDAARQNAYVRVRPIKNRNDILGYGWPEYPFK